MVCRTGIGETLHLVWRVDADCQGGLQAQAAEAWDGVGHADGADGDVARACAAGVLTHSINGVLWHHDLDK
jgi:hypothetical protein